MNRDDLQKLSTIRAREAQLLFSAGESSGAYYLAGYAVECALKAVIARQTNQFDFPDKQRANDSFKHDLGVLLQTAGLKQELRQASDQDQKLASNWDTVVLWSETSRYRLHTDTDAHSIIEASSQSGHGVLQWLKQHW